MQQEPKPSLLNDIVAWSGAFALNLLLPLPLGFAATEGWGTFGMVSAVVLCWVVGLAVFLRSSSLKPVLIFGPLWVALSQIVVVPQFVAGVLALSFWSRLVGHDPLFGGRLASAVDGFVVTMLTAIPLFTAAWFFGGGLRVLLRGPNVQKQDAADYDERSALPLNEAQSHCPTVPGQPPPLSSC